MFRVIWIARAIQYRNGVGAFKQTSACFLLSASISMQMLVIMQYRQVSQPRNLCMFRFPLKISFKRVFLLFYIQQRNSSDHFSLSNRHLATLDFNREPALKDIKKKEVVSIHFQRNYVTFNCKQAMLHQLYYCSNSQRWNNVTNDVSKEVIVMWHKVHRFNMFFLLFNFLLFDFFLLSTSLFSFPIFFISPYTGFRYYKGVHLLVFPCFQRESK